MKFVIIVGTFLLAAFAVEAQLVIPDTNKVIAELEKEAETNPAARELLDRLKEILAKNADASLTRQKRATPAATKVAEDVKELKEIRVLLERILKEIKCKHHHHHHPTRHPHSRRPHSHRPHSRRPHSPRPEVEHVEHVEDHTDGMVHVNRGAW